MLTHGENKVLKLPLHFPNHFSSCSLRNTLKKSSHKTASPHGTLSLFLDHYWTLQTFCLPCFSYQQQLSSCLHYSCVLLHIFSPTMLYLIVIWLLSEAQCIEKYKTAVSWYIKSDHAWFITMNWSEFQHTGQLQYVEIHLNFASNQISQFQLTYNFPF